METKKRGWIEHLPIIFILLMASALYGFRIGQRSLWLDEGFSLYDTEHLKGIRLFYFLLLRAWMTFGSSETWLRSLSALFGIASVLLTYYLGLRLIGRRQALIAAFLLAVSPIFLYYAQQVRMYTLQTFFGIAGALLWCRVLELRSRLFTVGWLFTRFFGFMIHPIHILLFFADWAIAAFHFRRARGSLFKFTLWIFTGLVFCLPLAVYIFQTIFVAYSGKAPNFSQPVVWNWLNFMFWYPTQSRGSQLKLLWSGLQPLVLLLLSGLCFLGLTLRPRRPQAVWIACWAFVPSLIMAGIACIKNFHVIYYRYHLFVMPYFFLLLSDGYVKLWARQRIAALAAAVFYISLVSVGICDHYFGKDAYGQEDWRGAARKIRSEFQPDDVVIVPGPKAGRVLAYYLNEKETPIYYTRIWAFRKGRWLLFGNPLKHPVDRLPDQTERIWFVYRKSVWDTPATLDHLVRTLKTRFPVQERFDYRNIWLVLASRRPEPGTQPAKMNLREYQDSGVDGVTVHE